MNEIKLFSYCHSNFYRALGDNIQQCMETKADITNIVPICEREAYFRMLPKITEKCDKVLRLFKEHPHFGVPFFCPPEGGSTEKGKQI